MALKITSSSEMAHALPTKLGIEMRFFDATSLQTIYKEAWKEELVNRGQVGKLSILSQLDPSFTIENYVKILPRPLRKRIAAVRVSAHSFEIETGRYTRPITPANERICKFCDANAIGDEKHAILECTLSQLDRQQFIRDIGTLGYISRKFAP